MVIKKLFIPDDDGDRLILELSSDGKTSFKLNQSYKIKDIQRDICLCAFYAFLEILSNVINHDIVKRPNTKILDFYHAFWKDYGAAISIVDKYNFVQWHLAYFPEITIGLGPDGCLRRRKFLLAKGVFACGRTPSKCMFS
uniref:Uncharacterized protein n=1 Tax=Acrobeloides nanus TaxID=290746 RepID=A0A914ENG3_9BILA